MRQSDIIKRDMLYYCLIQCGHTFAVTECLNGADVLAVTKSDKSIEYEIKVSRADLKKELDIMTYVIDEDYYRRKMAEIEPGQLAIFGPEYPHGQELLRRHFSFKGANRKIEKHKQNLTDVQRKWPAYQPNQYYFVVPESLATYAAERLAKEDSPYGLIVTHEYRSRYYCQRKARKLHAANIGDRELRQVMRRACLENMTLREKITATVA